MRELLAVDSKKVFLIGEREGAYAVTRAVLSEQVECRGVVMVHGGGLSVADLRKLGECDLLSIAGTDRVAGRNQSRLAEAVRLAEVGGRVELRGAATRPWPLALGLAAADLEAWIRSRSE